MDRSALFWFALKQDQTLGILVSVILSLGVVYPTATCGCFQ